MPIKRDLNDPKDMIGKDESDLNFIEKHKLKEKLFCVRVKYAVNQQRNRGCFRWTEGQPGSWTEGQTGQSIEAQNGLSVGIVCQHDSETAGK